MCRAIPTLFLAMTLAGATHAQEREAKPNTLTPREIAEGWILLFDGETTFGWRVEEHGNQKASVQLAEHALDLSKLSSAELVSTSMFGDFEMSFEYRGGNEEISFAGLHKFARRGLAKAARWTAVHVRNVGKQVDFKDANGGGSGQRNHQKPVAICFEQRNGVCPLMIRNIKLRPLNANSLFNGKDLTGWKVFPGDKYKSLFTATDQKEINVKNGPGDLQTTGKYKDFLLQLECISHGKHLNSGIFFRCRDNEYQNGYEAQIRNQFTPEAKQEYLLEVYDPSTKRLIEKKKIMSTAVDYGTGAIYRRQPARKDMAKDGAWFGMTILAHGNHLATWVNGVQVTDWTDNRPASDNARTGCRLEAGHISIQGHDPTTNLSFRNLRIATLPDD